MVEHQDGGPAFPLAFEYTNRDGSQLDIEYGMSLRDYFAAKAMQGDIVSSGDDCDFGTCVVLAEWAYKVADAMLKAREESKS